MITMHISKENKNETYGFFPNDSRENLKSGMIEWGTKIRRPPMIFIFCSGVYSVPNGAYLGIAAVA